MTELGTGNRDEDIFIRLIRLFDTAEERNE